MLSSDGGNQIDFPLYHGTSTIFLEDIIKHGLGGLNPIEEWQVLECARDILPLAQKYLSADRNYANKMRSFEMMTRQSQDTFNFQHGDTYLSPAKFTAIRYAINTRYGSELLTYTVHFLDGLVRLGVSGVCDDLYQKYPHVFHKLDISVAPLLIEVEGVKSCDLLSEKGDDPQAQFELILKAKREHPDFSEDLIQQNNFRLKKHVAASKITVWLIIVSKWDIWKPEYTMRRVTLES